MEIIAQHSTLFLVLAIVFGLYMTWGIGANDVANAMGTSVGSGSITVKQAIMIAAVMEFCGAYLAGGGVASTISKGIIDGKLFEPMPEHLVMGMLAALLAAGIWLMVASFQGWPVSTTHTIVGAVVGIGVAAVGTDAVQWGKLGEIVASWFVSPVLGGILGLLLMLSIQKLILNTEDPIAQARKWGPAYAFLVGWIVALVTLTKGLKHVGLHLSTMEGNILAVVVGILLAIIGRIMMGRVKIDTKKDNKDFRFASVEKLFIPMMIFTGAAMAFAHGSNDVANGIGPMAAVINLINSGGIVAAKSPVAPWMLLIGGIGIVVGLATYGYKVMQTIGTKITELTPTRGYAATLAGASVVVLASGLGLPVSTTHIAVGAVMGVGIARGIGAIDLKVIGGIVLSWFVTVPAGAILAAIFYYVMKGMFL
ncbi:MAG: inorganic phosphate transporter [Chromatiaceae bacterium]|nr:inorganic phosphate transporter [Chromatiaceae bacterium]MCP5409461.1 inorganic phosphate transporter [Chromatiaceae bacterium]MCP5444303.1 inorganic phosphate transporter [Chromatiaceae bacterium]